MKPVLPAVAYFGNVQVARHLLPRQCSDTILSSPWPRTFCSTHRCYRLTLVLGSWVTWTDVVCVVDVSVAVAAVVTVALEGAAVAGDLPAVAEVVAVESLPGTRTSCLRSALVHAAVFVGSPI